MDNQGHLTELVRKAQGADPQEADAALEDIFHETARWVAKWATWYTSNPTDIEEIVSEAYLEVCKSIRNLHNPTLFPA